jgi:hypothetical protein
LTIFLIQIFLLDNKNTMELIMKRYHGLGIVILMMVATHADAYGVGDNSRSGSVNTCTKPRFSDFFPADKSEAAPGSSFSFRASGNTHPETIKVTVKGVPAIIEVGPKTPGSSVTVHGKLPAELKDQYAKILIDAQSNCKGSYSWLVKITE